MYAVLGIWTVPGTRAERVESIETHVVPFVRTVHGFHDARYAFDTDSDRAYTYVAFDTEADARRFIDLVATERRPVQQAHGVQLDQEFVLLDILLEVAAEPAAAA
ncbi:hypothetical protein [Agrococcus beijingensis]|uniref:hypothetical protein n=1 Tax=Agrococcus beijingensis TaxID=3068634 RepID=UPI002741D7CD|nr:hypothetical protein [Agrococcus sp. REN33]